MQDSDQHSLQRDILVSQLCIMIDLRSLLQALKAPFATYNKRDFFFLHRKSFMQLGNYFASESTERLHKMKV